MYGTRHYDAPVPRSHHSSSDAVSLAWRPDGKRIAVGSGQGLHIQDATAGKLLTPEPVWSLAWHPDSSRVVTGSRQGAARVWEITSGRLLTTLDSGDATHVVAWSPDGTGIATAGASQDVHLWDAGTGTRTDGIDTGHRNGILALAWSPDGDRVATAGDSTAQILDVATGRVLRVLEHGAHVCSVAWNPDGKHLLTTTDENCLASLWDAGTGELLRTFGYREPVEDWYPYPWDASWSPDGKRILTAPSLEGVRVWDATSGKLIRALQDPGVEAVGWGPGGNLVASTTGRAIRFWDTETWECSAEVPLTGSRDAPV